MSNQGFYFFAHFEGDVGLYREKIEKIFVPYLTTGGYVGLSIATLLSQHHKVYAVDIVPSKVELINQRRMIDILAEIRKKDTDYKLLMVGTGELKVAVETRINELELQDAVQVVERIPNSDIWELYRLADAFVNLNQQEIFGMAILEEYARLGSVHAVIQRLGYPSKSRGYFHCLYRQSYGI